MQDQITRQISHSASMVWKWQKPESPPRHHLQPEVPVKITIDSDALNFFLARSGRDLVALVAFLIVAAEFTYWLGRRSRLAIETASDTLSAAWAIAMGVGQDHHHETVDQAIDLFIAAVIAQWASPATQQLAAAAVAAPPAPPRPLKGRPTPSRPSRLQLVKS
jgi:hypothetical protein